VKTTKGDIGQQHILGQTEYEHQISGLTSLIPSREWLIEAEAKSLLVQTPVHLFLTLTFEPKLPEGLRGAQLSFEGIFDNGKSGSVAAIGLQPVTNPQNTEKFYTLIDLTDEEKDKILTAWQAKADELAKKNQTQHVYELAKLTDHHLELELKEAVARIKTEVRESFEARRSVALARYGITS